MITFLQNYTSNVYHNDMYEEYHVFFFIKSSKATFMSVFNLL